ncbi:MAG: sulfite exporter TauE/SafE family protein [Myxococcota bacterium]
MLSVSAWLAIGSCAVAGLLSIPHCALMCGPIAGLARSGPRRDSDARGSSGPNPVQTTGTRTLRYHLGRLSAYGALGAGAGALGGLAKEALTSTWASAAISWILAVVLATAAYRLWQPQTATVRLRLSKSDRTLTERIARLLPRDGLFLGLLTGLLPCGALYGAIALAAGAGSPLGGALGMIAFATTSAAGLLGAGWMFGWLTAPRRKTASRIAAAALAVGAVLFAIRPLPTLRSAESAPACCEVGAASDL